MEEKLAAYRARKAKERADEHSLINRLRHSFSFEANSEHKSPEPKGRDSKKLNEDAAESSEDLKDAANTEGPLQSRTTYWTLAILKILLWFCLWGLFIELQFGAVFFTISLILFIYFNTRSGNKDSSLSAYSVFNKDCERIQGTLTAEQMQRNMFRVPGLPS